MKSDLPLKMPKRRIKMRRSKVVHGGGEGGPLR